MKRIAFMLMLLVMSACSMQESFDSIADRVFELAKVQFEAMDGVLTDDITPRSTNADGTFRTADIYWWCSGFFPGSLWYTYLYTGDERMKDWLTSILPR